MIKVVLLIVPILLLILYFLKLMDVRLKVSSTILLFL